MDKRDDGQVVGRKHAILSPSSAYRWLKCTKSARLEETLPERETTASEEGTFAHELSEVELKYFKGEMTKSDHAAELERLQSSEYYSAGLAENVALYVDTVSSKYAAAYKADNFTQLDLELLLDLSAYVPESFGYADAIIINDTTLDVIDLKYGAGIAVKAKDNPQLRLYALGALEYYEFIHPDVEKVTLTIVQPRNGGVSEEVLTVEELLDWGESIKEIAAQAYAGTGEYCAGTHCRFCKASELCRAHAEYQLAIAREEFDEPNLMTKDELAEIVKRADSLKTWLEKVKAYVLESALKGEHYEGLKVVEGRSSRKIIDKDTAARILLENGGNENVVWKPRELNGLPALEKAFGKDRLNGLIGSLIEKPVGAPVLVPESDKRAEWKDVKSEFVKLED